MTAKKKAPKRRASQVLRVPTETLTALETARPEAFINGASQGVVSLACEAANIDPPPSPKDRMAAAGRKATGKAKRPKNIKGGRKKKGDRENG